MGESLDCAHECPTHSIRRNIWGSSNPSEYSNPASVSIPENAGGSTSPAVAKQVSLATIASAWNLQHEPSPLFLRLRLKTFLSLSK